MPQLDTKLHLNMLERGKKRRLLEAEKKRPSIIQRILNQFQQLMTGKNTQSSDKKEIYGLEWGDPETQSTLAHVRDHFLKPYLSPATTVLEIGPGGGRWTRYMLDAKKVYAVDYHQELLDELRSNYDSPKVVHILNNGDDFPGVPDGSVDFLFSFGTFVHLDVDIIARYLQNMKPVLAEHANVVIQYSDKTKDKAKDNPTFSENTPHLMRQLLLSSGYTIVEEELNILDHSSIVRFVISKTD